MDQKEKTNSYIPDLYNNALALRLEKEDAVIYASYWNRNKNESAGYDDDNI